MGLPILEAIACGTPIVTSNTSSMPEIANGSALLVAPYQPVEIAGAITEIHQNRKLVASLIQQGFASTQKRYQEFYIKKVTNIYQKVIKNKTIK